MGAQQSSTSNASAPLVRDILAAGELSFSFEFSPPKTDEGEANLFRAIRELESISPTFVSVTYGAGGSSREHTLRVTERIATETDLTPVAHLTCVGHAKSQVRSVIGDFIGAGIRNILAVRGDPPEGPRAEWIKHPEGFEHADELVAYIKDLGDFCVGVGAFPEVHPAAISREHDLQVLLEKFRRGADYAITQFFFDADDYFRLRDDVVKAGFDQPIIPGLMPVTNVRQIERFSELQGSEFPPLLAERLRAVAEDNDAVRAIGVEVGTELAQKLLDGGAPGIHFNTLNRAISTREIFDSLTIPTR